MKTEKELGAAIKELRGSMSLRDFAKKCDISHTTIDNLEKGFDFRTGKPVQVKIATLQKIADACGVPLSKIIGDKEKPTVNNGELSESRQKLIDWAQSVPESEVDRLLQLIDLLLEARK